MFVGSERVRIILANTYSKQVIYTEELAFWMIYITVNVEGN